MSPTCTITIGHDRRCGKPAVRSFVGVISGETFHECLEHRSPDPAAPAKPIAPRLVRCRRAECVDLMMGPHFTIEHRLAVR